MERMLTGWRRVATRQTLKPFIIGAFVTSWVFSFGLSPLAAFPTVYLLCYAFGRGSYGATLLWLWGSAFRFRTLQRGRVRLKYQPRIADELDRTGGGLGIEEIYERCERALSKLEERFGFPLKRPTVVLYEDMSAMNRVFDSDASGRASIHTDTVYLSGLLLKEDTWLDETLIHEFAHVFSRRLGKLRPSFKSEGLSTWLQGTVWGKDIDSQSRVIIQADRYLPLISLLEEDTFYEDMHAHYALAGSFTGFILRRFGWDKYRRFYQEAADAAAYEAAFEPNFGESLTGTEREWLKDLLEGRLDPDRPSDMAVRIYRVQTAYNNWQLFQCIEEGQQILQEDPSNKDILWIVASSYLFLGQYEKAAPVWRQTAQASDEANEPNASLVWLQLGHTLDLTGQRKQALAAYRTALERPDYDSGWIPSAHEDARRYMERPYTEQDRLAYQKKVCRS